MTTAGNASLFGNLAVGSYEVSAMSNTIRCLFAGGENPSGDTDRIEYVEFASEGNGADFGNLLEAKDGITGGSNQTRGLTAGGTQPSHVDVVEYVTLATLGSIDIRPFSSMSSMSYRFASFPFSFRIALPSASFTLVLCKSANILVPDISCSNAA